MPLKCTVSEVKSLRRVRLFATPWTVGHQAPASMGFPRQEYWSGLPFPFPGDRPNQGIEFRSPALQADSLLSEPMGKRSRETVPRLLVLWDSLVAETVKRLPTMWETRVRSLGWDDPLEKEMATHSSTLA